MSSLFSSHTVGRRSASSATRRLWVGSSGARRRSQYRADSRTRSGGISGGSGLGGDGRRGGDVGRHHARLWLLRDTLFLRGGDSGESENDEGLDEDHIDSVEVVYLDKFRGRWKGWK